MKGLPCPESALLRRVGMLKSVALALLCCAPPLSAQTLYKSVGPDGKVVYSDRPPVEGKLEKTMKVEDFPNTALPPGLKAELEQMRKDGAKVVLPAASVVLYAASWCGYCRQARAYLASKGIKYEEIDIDTASGKSAFAAAGGGGGVPLLVSNGQHLRGFSVQAYERLFASRR